MPMIAETHIGDTEAEGASRCKAARKWAGRDLIEGDRCHAA